MRVKRYQQTDVLTAARDRVSKTFDGFERIYVSFSGGKDEIGRASCRERVLFEV